MKDEPPCSAARLVGFGSIHLLKQGNVAIPVANIQNYLICYYNC